MSRILTNKFNLPETLVKAIKYDTHVNAGTISVTQLIDGAQVRMLKKKHDYESDVVDNLYALMGTALHHIIERANIDSVRKRAFILTAETLIVQYDNIKGSSPEKAEKLKSAANWLFSVIPVFFPETVERYIFEKTLIMELRGGHVLSGTFDLFDKHTETLFDYKFCSVFQFVNPNSRKKWVEQLNIYALMLRREGYKVSGLRIVAFFRDWNSHGFMKDRGYPERQISEIYIPLWEEDVTMQLIERYLDDHIRADEGNCPPCGGEVRWAKSDEYAVKTPTAKRAMRILDTEPAAQLWIQENGHKYKQMTIEKRPGGSARCEKYCVVSKHCPQWALEQAQAIKNAE